MIQDLNEHNKYVENHVEWDKAYFELDLKDNSGLARFCFYQCAPAKINKLFKILAKWATDKNTSVLLMPDMLGQTDFVTEARTGGWMEKDNFIE